MADRAMIDRTPRRRAAAPSLVALVLALSTGGGRAAEPASVPTVPPDPARVEAAARVHRLHRSLHALHDRALTDRAAPSLAAALGRMLDDALAGLPGGTDMEPRTLAALVARALSGGDAAALRAALDAAGPSVDPALADALSLHLARAPGAADALAGALAAMPRETAALARLTLGSLPGDGGAAHLERAALLAPGTLIEEAALRRRLALPPPDDEAARAREARAYAGAATAHLHRFARSPHRERVLATVARGLAARAARLDAASVETILDAAPALALPLAREAVLAGAAEMAETALARAGDGPRARAYREAVRVPATPEAVVAADRDDPLARGDRAIASARASIAAAILATPARPSRPGRAHPMGPRPVEPMTDIAVPDIDVPDIAVPGLDEALAGARAALERAR